MAGRLAGRTIFVTGGSRGIGLTIAKRCAEDGANIVLAAKTATPHPKLPGTLYTAAAEVEAAGGKCLPCVVDIQYEDQVSKAVDETIAKFGGIDILINNASAIHLTGTDSTPMKRYDLMHHINTRGTFMCSKLCLPHLQKSAELGNNPQILNISPPLVMSTKWFKDHVAYTMAKYGMSMCVLGMAEEFKPYGIGVNALWPQTGIYTAAMAMLGGGDAIKSQCRRPEIMSDAAYAILTKDAKVSTGNFYIDELVMKSEGVTNLDHYAYDPTAVLMPDFFLPDVTPDDVVQSLVDGGGVPAFSNDTTMSAMSAAAAAAPEPAAAEPATAGDAAVQATFTAIQAAISPEVMKSVNGIIQFDLKEAGMWYLDMKSGEGDVGMGKPPAGKSDCTMTLSADDFQKMFVGKLNPTMAYMGGKLKIKGNLGVAMRLETLMKKMLKSKL